MLAESVYMPVLQWSCDCMSIHNIQAVIAACKHESRTRFRKIIGFTDFRRWLDLITSIFGSSPWLPRIIAGIGCWPNSPGPWRHGPPWSGSMSRSRANLPAERKHSGHADVRLRALAIARKQIARSPAEAGAAEIVIFWRVCLTHETATGNSHRRTNYCQYGKQNKLLFTLSEITNSNADITIK